MRTLLALLLAVGLLAAAPRVALNRAENTSVVVIGDMYQWANTPFGIMEGTTYSQPFCSGNVIEATKTDEIILTARHCVAETNEYGDDGKTVVSKDIPTPTHVLFFNGDKGTVTRTVAAKYDDLGLIYVHSMRRHEAAPIGGEVKRLAPYFVVGMPLGQPWSYNEAVSMQGAVYNQIGDPGDHTYLFSCSGCGPGDSGAAVFDYFGNVVAVVVAGNEYGEFMAIPSARIIPAVAHMERAAKTAQESPF